MSLRCRGAKKNEGGEEEELAEARARKKARGDGVCGGLGRRASPRSALFWGRLSGWSEREAKYGGGGPPHRGSTAARMDGDAMRAALPCDTPRLRSIRKTFFQNFSYFS